MTENEKQILQRALDLAIAEDAACDEPDISTSYNLLDQSLENMIAFIEELAVQARLCGLQPTGTETRSTT